MSSNPEALRNALADRYEILRELGAGGMATVYLANDLRHQRQVAVKVLRPELAGALGPDRFLREIRIAANLTHPHILPLHDSGEAEGFLYYVMPYIEGQTLRERVDEEGELPIGEAVRILREVVDALAFAHGKGVVHRDIKPDNVMLTGGHAIVADFGVAKAVGDATGGDKLTTAGIALGTPAYMSPEQASADPHVDHRADIYAVGAMAYELLAGRPPFTGATPQSVLAAHVTQEAEPLSKYRSQVSGPLAVLVMRCLQKKPADRWQSAAEMLPQLEMLTTPSGGVTPTDTKPFDAVRGGQRKAVVALAALVVAVATVAIVLALRPRRPPVPSELDPDRLAIAPFDVLGTGVDSSWSEDLAILVRNALDGAGGIRTTDANQTIRQWNGLVPPNVGALAQVLGSGLVVTGTLVGAGSDSVRISALLHDAAADATVGSRIELRLASGRIDNAADSIAVRLLGVLSETRPDVGAFQLRSIGSTNPAAIREFLRGEQFFRAGTMDSALASYQRAVDIDSTFALAYSRLAYASWTNESPDAWTRYAIMAGRFNHGLAPRESLLVLSDSLWGAIGPINRLSLAQDRRPAIAARLGATMLEASRLYPNDPEVWYRLAEYRFHIAWTTTVEDAIAEADIRVTELDSSLIPAYAHLSSLSGTKEQKRAWISGLLRGRIGGIFAGSVPGSESALAVLSTERPDTLDWQAMRTRLTGAERTGLAWRLASTTDASELAVEALRILPDGEFKATLLAFRGHAAEALAAAATPEVRAMMALELGLVGALDPDSVDAMAAAYTGDWPHTFFYPWWAARRDTSAIATALEQEIRVGERRVAAGRPLRELESLARAWGTIAADSQLTSADSASGLRLYREKVIEPYLAFARAYQALARGDSTEALRLFRDVPSGGLEACGYHPFCAYNRLATAELLSARGEDREAARMLIAPLQPPENQNGPGATGVVWVLERGRVNERLGNREEAIAAYSYVTDVWSTADSVLQELYVRPAREGLARLIGER